MYDTDDYDGGIGIDPGAYSLYASGSYNNNSRTPAALMTFERIQMGWLDKSQLIKLDKPADVTLPLMTTNTAAYVDARPGLAEGEGYEWYVFEIVSKQVGIATFHTTDYSFTTLTTPKAW